MIPGLQLGTMTIKNYVFTCALISETLVFIAVMEPIQAKSVDLHGFLDMLASLSAHGPMSAFP